MGTYSLLSNEREKKKTLKAHTVHTLAFFPRALLSASLSLFKMCFCCVSLDTFKSGIVFYDNIQVKSPWSGNLHIQRDFLAHWFFSGQTSVSGGQPEGIRMTILPRGS